MGLVKYVASIVQTESVLKVIFWSFYFCNALLDA